MSVPPEELRQAATVLSDLEWLADEIDAWRSDPTRIERQRRASGVLLSSLDTPADNPWLVKWMYEHDVDAEVMLRWYASDIPPAGAWQPYLSYVRRGVDLLREPVERAIAAVDAATRDQLAVDIAARRAAIEEWIAGPGPWR
jgi:hypothetical protein